MQGSAAGPGRGEGAASSHSGSASPRPELGTGEAERLVEGLSHPTTILEASPLTRHGQPRGTVCSPPQGPGPPAPALLVFICSQECPLPHPNPFSDFQIPALNLLTNPRIRVPSLHPRSRIQGFGSPVSILGHSLDIWKASPAFSEPRSPGPGLPSLSSVAGLSRRTPALTTPRLTSCAEGSRARAGGCSSGSSKARSRSMALSSPAAGWAPGDLPRTALEIWGGGRGPGEAQGTWHRVRGVGKGVKGWRAGTRDLGRYDAGGTGASSRGPGRLRGSGLRVCGTASGGCAQVRSAPTARRPDRRASPAGRGGGGAGKAKTAGANLTSSVMAKDPTGSKASPTASESPAASFSSQIPALMGLSGGPLASAFSDPRRPARGRGGSGPSPPPPPFPETPGRAAGASARGFPGGGRLGYFPLQGAAARPPPIPASPALLPPRPPAARVCAPGAAYGPRINSPNYVGCEGLCFPRRGSSVSRSQTRGLPRGKY